MPKLEPLDWCARAARRRIAKYPAATLSFITRLRLDAALYQPAPPHVKGQNGRPRVKGARLPTLAMCLQDPATQWQKATLPWYGAVGRVYALEYASGTAVWYHSGMVPVPLRWVLIRDPQGHCKPQALLCTPPQLVAEEILQAFVRHWPMEVTFAEVPAHLGLDGQRPWSDTAVARSTPLRLGLLLGDAPGPAATAAARAAQCLVCQGTPHLQRCAGRRLPPLVGANEFWPV